MKPSASLAFWVKAFTQSSKTQRPVSRQRRQAMQSGKGSLPMKKVSVSMPSCSSARAAWARATLVQPLGRELPLTSSTFMGIPPLRWWRMLCLYCSTR